MASENGLMKKLRNITDNIGTYWNHPMPKRYMPMKEIAAYSGGGIGAYFIITLGTACILGTGNVLLTSTLGIGPMDMYIMYVIAVLANIPLTGIRATIIDNTRNKAGKYRPYIVTMAIPTAIICILMVWFPYEYLYELFPGVAFYKSDGTAVMGGYIAKCALIMVFNLLLHFFYYFFYDSYENLIHVLSPDSQERADVSSVKCIVYSFAPTIYGIITPAIAGGIFKTTTTDIRIYRLLFPILAILGLSLCIVVFRYTQEKIVQARSHVIAISFTDSLRAVAKNKYFWIISLASWIGFLEIAYQNILNWLYNYGGTCTWGEYTLLTTIYGNASLWGMLLAPFCIRKWGKKAVLVVTNLFNIVFILMMLPFTNELKNATIWLVMMCLWFNALMGSFAHILNPAIQADIRDYQQFKTGERIDGMFSAVSTIGTVIALVTSSVLPYIYEKKGLTEANAIKVTSDPNILNRIFPDGKTVAQILEKQFENGQNSYSYSYSALYDPDILLGLLKVLIIVAAIGATMNVIPFFWYDFNERKQKSVVRVLRVRALFEDYGNGVCNDERLVEAIDIIRNARQLASEEVQPISKKSYKSVKRGPERREAKKAYKEAFKRNEEIEISKFVCLELDKFSRPAAAKKVELCRNIYSKGLNGLKDLDKKEIKKELRAAKKMPKTTADEKDLREFMVDMARNKLRACKVIKKFYKDKDIEKFDFAVLEALFEKEDKLNDDIKKCHLMKAEAKKAKDKSAVKDLTAEIKRLQNEKKKVKREIENESKTQLNYNRVAKPFSDAEKLLKEKENFAHFDDIAAKYEESKASAEAAKQALEEERLRLEKEKQEKIRLHKEEKEKAKASKKEKATKK